MERGPYVSAEPGLDPVDTDQFALPPSVVLGLHIVGPTTIVPLFANSHGATLCGSGEDTMTHAEEGLAVTQDPSGRLLVRFPHVRRVSVRVLRVWTAVFKDEIDPGCAAGHPA